MPDLAPFRKPTLIGFVLIMTRLQNVFEAHQSFPAPMAPIVLEYYVTIPLGVKTSVSRKDMVI